MHKNCVCISLILPSQFLSCILGLDPAGLLFRGDKKSASEKLDAEDAEFVEVIHTNMGQLGLEGQIGHADFYPVCSSIYIHSISFPDKIQRNLHK